MYGEFDDLMKNSFDPSTFHSNNTNDEGSGGLNFLRGQEIDDDDNYWFLEE